MDKNSVRIDIILKKPLGETEWCRIVRLLTQWPELTPERYGLHEPLRNRFDVMKSDEIVQAAWKSSDLTLKLFLWKSSLLGLQGTIGTKWFPMPDFSPVSVYGQIKNLNYPRLECLSKFCEGIAAEFDLLFGYVHLFSEQDISRGTNSCGILYGARDNKQKYSTGLPSPMRLRFSIPDLFWGTTFGPDYVELFGSDRIRTAPAAIVKEVSPSTFYVQLTETIVDMATRFDYVENIRKRVKDHLAVDAFWRSDAPPGHQYVVPLSLAEEPKW